MAVVTRVRPDPWPTTPQNELAAVLGRQFRDPKYAACVALYRPHVLRRVRILFRRWGRPADATGIDEVVTNVFESFVFGRCGYNPEQSPWQNYLQRIVHHKTIDYFDGFRGLLTQLDVPKSVPAPSDDNRTTDRFERDRTAARRVYLLTTRRNPIHGQVLALRWAATLSNSVPSSVADVATWLGLKEENVRKIERRASERARLLFALTEPTD